MRAPRLVCVAVEDPRLDVFRSLHHEDRAVQRSLFVVEGHLLVQRLLASRFPVQSLVITDRKVKEFRRWLPHDVPIYVLPAGDIHQLVGFRFHRGVLACGVRLPGPQLNAAMAATILLYELGQKPSHSARAAPTM